MVDGPWCCGGWYWIVVVVVVMCCGGGCSCSWVDAFGVSSSRWGRVVTRSHCRLGSRRRRMAFEEESPLLVDSQYQSVWTCHGSELQRIVEDIRTVLQELYEDPRQPNADRFVWDPWVVTCGQQGTRHNNETSVWEGMDVWEEGCTKNQIQYSLKRATCSSLLKEEELYERVCEALSELGESVGLMGMTPPWISCYTTGDWQNFHTDASHGPLAFVWSVTSPDHYRGGDTMLLQPAILDYWQHVTDGPTIPNLEAPTIVRTIPTRQGRCLAFDPRIPHGVTPVTSLTNDPFASGRIVIHGWFCEPQLRCFGSGFHDSSGNNDSDMVQQCQQILETQAFPKLGLEDIGRVVGYLAIRLQIAPSGQVDSLTTVCDTLQADRNDYRGIIGYDVNDNPVTEDAPADVRLTLHELLSNLYFPSLLPTKDNDDTTIQFDSDEYERVMIIPFLFE